MLRLRTTTIAVAALLSACITPHHMDIAQGNIVTQEMVDQLRPGMTRSQVRFVLGTPLVTDSFHPDRWDYFYSLHKGVDAKPQTRHLTVVFRDDVLASIEGDVAVKTTGGDTAITPAPPPDSTTDADNKEKPLRAL